MKFIEGILSQALFDWLFNRVLAPVLKFIGSLIRWIFCFGQTSFKEILKKDYNTRLGLIVTILMVFILMFLL